MSTMSENHAIISTSNSKNISDDRQTLVPTLRTSRRLSNSSSVNLLDTSRSPNVQKQKLPEFSSQVGAGRKSNLDPKKYKSMLSEIYKILKKNVDLRTEKELNTLNDWKFLVPEAEARRRRNEILKQRAIEQEESLEEIETKTEILTQFLLDSRYTVIYTGAGISTSASIPDYRGPNGLWTQIRKTGTFSITKNHDLSNAEPTFTHMAISELCKRKFVNHVVSQNCDGLHIRSGVAKSNLSEIHGNMYMEVCAKCSKQYYRQADVTERTSRYHHKTGRKCHLCRGANNYLIDTIVLYGERSRTQWPMNWTRASKAASKADLIICLGSSLKTLRSYESLWPKKTGGKKGDNDVKLVIVNLQYTSKDKSAVLKINGKCDVVMRLLMNKLEIEVPKYDSATDPLRKLEIPFTQEEILNLKRSLLFEQKIETVDRNLSQSPSLFVSLIQNDPLKRSVKVRIRSLTPSSRASEVLVEPQSESEQAEKEDCHDQQLVKLQQYKLPGWLGKSLTSSKPTSLKRKRHGNKGRKNSAHKKVCNDAEDNELCNSLSDETILTIKSEPDIDNTVALLPHSG